MFLLWLIIGFEYNIYIMYASASHNPLAAGEEGDKLRGNGATDVAQDGDGRDGCPDRDERLGLIAANEINCDGGKEKHVHEVHAEAQLSNGRNKSRRGLMYGGEHKEESVGGQQDIQRAELPAPFEHRRLNRNARHAFQPKAPRGEGCSSKEADETDTDSATVAPLEVEADIVCQDKIAEVARAVPQGMEAVPKAFAPQLVADKAVQPRHDCGEGKDVDEYPLLFRRCFLQPGRHDVGDIVG